MGLRQWAGSFAGGVLHTGMAKLNARHPWSHNEHFHSWILANLPRPCETVLDVGCGQGALLAALAPYADRVVGTDIDEDMREQARRRCAGLPNVVISDAAWTAGHESYDVITMIAVLHHLDIAEALHEIRRRLNPGGRFLAVGLAAPVTVHDHAWDIASMVTNPVIGYVKHPWPSTLDGTEAAPFPIRDPTVSYGDLRRLLDQAMPEAVLNHRLAFRHTIAWTKPSSSRP